MEIGRDSKRRIWIVIDELPALGKLPALSRKYLFGFTQKKNYWRTTFCIITSSIIVKLLTVSVKSLRTVMFLIYFINLYNYKKADCS